MVTINVRDKILPLVLLLHGLGGSGADMTDPEAARAGTAFDRSSMPPGYTDRGFNITPPPLPATGFLLDPPLTGLTSWQQALNNAGFSTAVESLNGPTIASDVAQLSALAKGILTTHPDVGKLPIAIVAHSRGGLVARALLVAATTDPSLATFLSRVSTVVTLHSPHTGSTLANSAIAVDTALARIQAAFTTIGVTPPLFLGTLRGMVLNPAIAELAIGAPTAAIAPGEPVPGITYHTFGGNSTTFARLWANAFTPDSFVPLPFFPFFPLFHWASSSLLIGEPLNAVSFLPIGIALAPVPGVVEIAAAMVDLLNTVPELAPGVGDVFVTDPRSRLPFEASHTTNALNHAEALWDRTLQSQVVAILSRLRIPATPQSATATISPFPIRPRVPTTYRVTARDDATGALINSGTVTIAGTFGHPAVVTNIQSSFAYTFIGRAVGPPNDREVIFPSVSANLGSVYGRVQVDTGL